MLLRPSARFVFAAIVSYINGSAPHTRLRMWPNEVRDGIHALTMQLDESQKQAEIIQSFGKQTSSEGASPKRAREEMIVSMNPGKRIKDGRDIEDEQANLPTSPQTIYDRTISARSSATLVSSK